jgi:hypothetical protein
VGIILVQWSSNLNPLFGGASIEEFWKLNRKVAESSRNGTMNPEDRAIRMCQNSFTRDKSLLVEPSLSGRSPVLSGVCPTSEV